MVEVDYAANGRKSLGPGEARCGSPEGILRCRRQGARTSLRTGYRLIRPSGSSKARKPATVNYELAMLRRAFRLGARAGKVAARPEIQMLHVENARKGFFEPEQYRAVMKHLPEYLDPSPRSRTSLAGAPRASSDAVNGATSIWPKVGCASTPANRRMARAANFPSRLICASVLEAQREIVRTIEREQACVIPWVFVHPDGSRIKDFRWAWRKACRGCRRPGRLVHDFRRTAVRNLERAGVPRSAAMRMTGHKTEAVYRRYAITDSAMLQEAAVKLAIHHAAEEKSQVQPKSGSFRL